MGKGAKAPPPPVYTSQDGRTFADPNKAADRDRELQLAAAFGYNANQYAGHATPIIDWLSTAGADTQREFQSYKDQGLTAADYRAEQQLKKQEEEAKQAEEQRKSTIAGSRSSVDSAFGSFNDDYYNGIAKSVLDYYLPQLDDQFGKAGEQLTYKLARQGLLHSDTAGDERAKLQGKYDIERGGIEDRAATAARNARESVASTKNRLYQLADSAADPAAVNTQLSTETGNLRAAAPELTPLAQVFTDYVSPVVQTVGNGLAAESQGYPGFNTGLFSSKNRPSSRVVR